MSQNTRSSHLDTLDEAGEQQIPAGARRLFVISIGIATLFVFFQSLTSGEFITEGLAGDVKEVWITIHGFTAYPIMVFSLLAAVVAAMRLTARRSLFLGSIALFVTAVMQWLLGHAISTLHMDWVTPFHVVLAFVVYGLAIWLAVRAARLRR